MHSLRKFEPISFAAGVTLLLLVACIGSAAQDQKMSLAATAFGTSTQLGRTFNIKILIESYSTPQDQQLLLEAFNRGGNDALVDALEKMPVRGRISTPGTVGYEVKYIRVWPTATGRRIRLVTDRPITIGELWRNSRSSDYSLSAVELELSDDSSKSTGTLLPACEIKMNKQHEIEIEAYQNPWRLGNFIDWSK